MKNFLAKISGYRWGINQRRIEKSQDDSFLENIVYSSAPANLKQLAVQKISDMERVKQIALSNAGSKSVHKAIERIDDPKFLQKIVLKYTKESSFGKSSALQALGKIKDKKIIFTIALNSQHNSIRKKCIERINTPEYLEKLLEKERVKTNRDLLKKKLEKHHIVFLEIKMEVKCPHCSQPVFINSLHDKMVCPFCTSPLDLTKEFWETCLTGAFEYRNEKSGNSQFQSKKFQMKKFPYASLNYSSIDNIKNIEIGCREAFPTCETCQEVQIFSIVKESKLPTIQCKKCNTIKELKQGSTYVKGLVIKKRKILGFISSEDNQRDSSSTKEMKPVVIKCVGCGGNLSIEAKTPRNTTCKFCGTQQYLPDPLWLSIHPIKTKKPWYLILGPMEFL